MRTEVARHGAILAAVIGVISIFPAQAGERQAETYVMTVYENASYGSEVLEGAADGTITRLARRQNRSRLSDQTNLCVAYVKTRQIEKATEACDFAIVASEKEARRLRSTQMFGRRSDRIAATGRAIALTNRGVVHALVGESDQARSLFERALELDSKENSAEGNLARLDRRTAMQTY